MEPGSSPTWNRPGRRRAAPAPPPRNSGGAFVRGVGATSLRRSPVTESATFPRRGRRIAVEGADVLEDPLHLAHGAEDQQLALLRPQQLAGEDELLDRDDVD